MAGNNKGARDNRSGFVLIATGLAALVLLAFLGVAVDIGRMFLVRSEAQAFADSAVIAAALELNGTTAGMQNARDAVTGNINRWHFGTSQFSGTTTEFSTAATGPWEAAPATAANYFYARVITSSNVSLYFMPAVVSQTSAGVAARAVAGQILKTSWKEGLFPFTVFARPDCTTTPCTAMDDDDTPPWGLVTGEIYTLRWPANPSLGNGNGGGGGNINVCPNDRTTEIMNLATALGGSERGYIEDTSAQLIRQTIVADYQSITREVGDFLTMTGGSKQSQLASLETRIQQDTDTNSQTYVAYEANVDANGDRVGNGRRIVAVPINDGGLGAGTVGTNIRMIGIGAFFLYPTGEYGNGGNQAWCAEYIGPYKQGGRGGGTPGGYVVRLLE